MPKQRQKWEVVNIRMTRNKKLLERAKALADKRNESLSELFRRGLQQIVEAEEKQTA